MSQQGAGGQQPAQATRLQAGVAGDSQYFWGTSRHWMELAAIQKSKLAGKGACLQGGSYT